MLMNVQQWNGEKITRDSRYTILDEIVIRYALEYDPKIDYIINTGNKTENE